LSGLFGRPHKFTARRRLILYFASSRLLLIRSKPGFGRVEE
jgi:hypothetical protein